MAGSQIPILIASWLLVALRIGPVLAFAPPFTMVRVPASVRLLLVLGLSLSIVSWIPGDHLVPDISTGVLATAAAREFALGSLFVLVYQLAFGALYFVGRAIDIQAGFGLALLIDPTTRSQTPLIGTLFVFAATGLFFAADGHLALMRLIAGSFDVVPLGTWSMGSDATRLAALISSVFALALGFAGVVMLALFLIDLAIALLARTVPQMNVLVLGFQVKTIALLLVLPGVFGLGGALLVRLMATVIDALSGLI